MSEVRDVSIVGGREVITKDLPPVMAEKVFAAPFKLVFKTTEGETKIIEVETLHGLKRVINQVVEGKLQETPRSSLMLQLWALLAEHCGFLRVPAKGMDAGLQVLGVSGKLLDDMSNLFGSFEEGVEALREMKKMTATGRINTEPNESPLPPRAETWNIDKVEQAAEQALAATPPAPEVDEAVEAMKVLREQEAAERAVRHLKEEVIADVKRLMREREAAEKAKQLAENAADGSLTEATSPPPPPESPK